MKHSGLQLIEQKLGELIGPWKNYLSIFSHRRCEETENSGVKESELAADQWMMAKDRSTIVIHIRIADIYLVPHYSPFPPI